MIFATVTNCISRIGVAVGNLVKLGVRMFHCKIIRNKDAAQNKII